MGCVYVLIRALKGGPKKSATLELLKIMFLTCFQTQYPLCIGTKSMLLLRNCMSLIPCKSRLAERGKEHVMHCMQQRALP